MSTITIWSDIACPWACLAVHRLWTARGRLGLADDVEIEHRAFVLEVVNERPNPRRAFDTEIAVMAGLEPAAGWAPWSAAESTYPVSTLLALESVQAAREQGAHAAATLDRALRQAMFAQSRCITLRHVILDVAGECGAVDVDALERALDDGSARRKVIDQHRTAVDGLVKSSPHVFAGGSDWANPGIEMHWDKATHAPVVERDDPGIYDEILRAATR